MAYRECPECGQQVRQSIEHVEILPGKKPVAFARWDCDVCGWSSTPDGGWRLGGV